MVSLKRFKISSETNQGNKKPLLVRFSQYFADKHVRRRDQKPVASTRFSSPHTAERRLKVERCERCPTPPTQPSPRKGSIITGSAWTIGPWCSFTISGANERKDQLLVREAQRSSRAAATAPAFPNIHAQIRNAIFQKARPGIVRK